MLPPERDGVPSDKPVKRQFCTVTVTAPDVLLAAMRPKFTVADAVAVLLDCTAAPPVMVAAPPVTLTRVSSTSIRYWRSASQSDCGALLLNVVIGSNG